jgi:hypothetical protein
MSIGDRIGIGRGGPGWHWPRVRLHRPTGIRSGSGGSGPPVTSPPVATPPVTTPAVRVRVPSASARVKPPAVLGRDLPEVRVETPEAAVEVPAGLTALP